MSESIYLREAISKIEQSEGDITANYQGVLIRQAKLNLQISIARSLERIADALEGLQDNKHTDKHTYNLQVDRR